MKVKITLYTTLFFFSQKKDIIVGRIKNFTSIEVELFV